MRERRFHGKYRGVAKVGRHLLKYTIFRRAGGLAGLIFGVFAKASNTAATTAR